MEAIERVSLTDQVVERVKQHILENELAENDRLPTERDLIQMFGVSRTVIREALRSLEAVGIIRVKSGDGIFVAGMQTEAVMTMISFQLQRDKQSQLEFLATRLVLECGALELCIDSLDEESVAFMRQCNNRMRDIANVNKDHTLEDINFHKTLFKASHNRIYSALSSLISDFFLEARKAALTSYDDVVMSANEHDKIVDALLRKDLQQAKEIMKLHVNRIATYKSLS